MNILSVTEVAKHLGITRQAVLTAIEEGRITAEKVGNQWVVRKKELAKYRVSEVRKKAGLRHGRKKKKKS